MTCSLHPVVPLTSYHRNPVCTWWGPVEVSHLIYQDATSPATPSFAGNLACEMCVPGKTAQGSLRSTRLKKRGLWRCAHEKSCLDDGRISTQISRKACVAVTSLPLACVSLSLGWLVGSLARNTEVWIPIIALKISDLMTYP